MGKLISRLTKGGKSKAQKAMANAESAAMAAVGRKTVRSKVNAVKRVAKKAAKAGLTAGAMAAASVIVRESRRSS
jgi:hypothetical protein